MYKNGKVDSVWGLTPSKIRIALKKDLNKSCLKLNFVQKSPRAHRVLCQWLKTTKWLKILSSDGNIKTYVGGWQPCYDLCVVENS